MKKIFLFTIALLLNGLVSQSQVTWEKLFSAKNTDVFRSVQEVPSGGYVVAGYTSDSTASDSDAYVVFFGISLFCFYKCHSKTESARSPYVSMVCRLV
mgnify:CR=1 FL=1